LVSTAGQLVCLTGQCVAVAGHCVEIAGQDVTADGQAVALVGQWVAIAGQWVLTAGQVVCAGGQKVASVGHWVGTARQAVGAVGTNVTTASRSTLPGAPGACKEAFAALSVCPAAPSPARTADAKARIQTASKDARRALGTMHFDMRPPARRRRHDVKQFPNLPQVCNLPLPKRWRQAKKNYLLNALLMPFRPFAHSLTMTAVLRLTIASRRSRKPSPTLLQILRDSLRA
jgi:hypothetical protein